MCTKSGVHAPLAIKFAKITAIVIFFYFAECAAGELHANVYIMQKKRYDMKIENQSFDCGIVCHFNIDIVGILFYD